MTSIPPNTPKVNAPKAYARPSVEALRELPESLRHGVRFFPWKEVPRKGKPRKVPISPSGNWGDASDPTVSVNFESALAHFQRDRTLAGVGVSMLEGYGLMFFDLDEVRDKRTGVIQPWALDFIHMIDSYTEVSPSGTGVKIFIQGALNGRACHFEWSGHEIEVYDHARFAALTGLYLDGTPHEVHDRQMAIDLLPIEEATVVPAGPPPDRSADPVAKLVDEIPDAELIEHIRRSKQGSKFEALMSGDKQGCGSFFAACGALCTILASWTRLNTERIDRIARTSGLIQGWEDWWDEDRPTRGQRVIAGACALAASGWLYDPNPPPASGDRILSPADPLPSAREFVSQLYTAGDVATLRHQEGVFFAWQAESGVYAEHTTSQLKADLYKFLEPAVYWTEPTRMKPSELVPFKPTKAKVENVVDALRAETNLPAAFTPPCWLGGARDLDPTDMLPCRNGLLHIPSRELHPATPSFFALNGVDFDFDANAPEPERWLRFLRDLWPKDEESPNTLQEMFGYFLTPRTHLQKIGLLVGPKRGGKGTIGRILRRVSGDRNACAPTLDAMSKQFGLAVLIGKTVAVISDARISGRTDTAVIAERLLSISGEDHQSIPRKFLPDWTGKLTTRFLLMTNELPKIEDASGALASRFVVLTLKRSFFGCEDHELFDNLLPELPGVLNWALKGRDRLYQRGYFMQPSASAELVERLEDLGSPVSAFLRDECETDPGFEVSQSVLFDAWKAWCLRNGRDRSGTAQVFARNIHAVMPWLTVTRPRDGDNRTRTWQGLRHRP